MKGLTLLLLILPMTVVGLSAQPLERGMGGSADSLFLQDLRRLYPQQPPAAAARLHLAAIAELDDPVAVASVLATADRVAGEGWLTSGERLLVLLLAADRTLLVDTSRLSRLLIDRRALGVGSRRHDDRLAERLVAQLRPRRTETVELVAPGDAPAEREFTMMLVNFVTVRGLRGREEINRDVEGYLERHASSPLAGIAERHLISPYAEADFGAAVHVGFVAGRPVGGLSDRFRAWYGPTLAGELYLHEIVLSAGAVIGVAVGRDAFRGGGERWAAGDAPLLAVWLGAGYELRWARLSLVPFVALSSQRLRGADTGVEDRTSLPTTGLRLGVEGAIQIGYRIPSDVGTHIDLRARLRYLPSALAGYDPGFRGGLLGLEVGFALVQRPYTGGEE